MRLVFGHLSLSVSVSRFVFLLVGGVTDLRTFVIVREVHDCPLLARSSPGLVLFIGFYLNKRILAECTTPVLTLFVDPAAAFLGISDLENVAALKEGLLVHLLCALGDFGLDAPGTDTLGDTSFPCFESLAGVIVDDEVFVRFINAWRESAVEPETANFLDVFKARVALVLQVVLGDVVLREAFSVLRLPDWDVYG